MYKEALFMSDNGINKIVLGEGVAEGSKRTFKICFHRSNEGRLYTRLNMYLTADESKHGKIFFPDKSFNDADVGYANVYISKELETYGFVRGEMVNYSMPNVEDFLSWAWEKRSKYGLMNVYFISHPSRGRYMVVFTEKELARVIIHPDGEIGLEWMDAFIICSDIELYLDRCVPLAQLILESAWQKKITLNDIEAMFVASKVYYFGIIYDWQADIKYYGELFDSAVQQGIFNQYISPSLHLRVVIFNSDNIVLLKDYQYYQVEELAKIFNKIN